MVIFPWLPHPCVTNERLLAISNLGLASNSKFGMLKRVALPSIGIEADPQRAALHMICIHRLSRASMNGSCVFLMCLNNWLEWLFFKIVFTHYIYIILVVNSRALSPISQIACATHCWLIVRLVTNFSEISIEPQCFYFDARKTFANEIDNSWLHVLRNWHCIQ